MNRSARITQGTAMAIYVVLADKPSAKLKSNIDKNFSGDNQYLISDTQWLISTDKIDSTISQELEISDGAAGVRAAVFRIAGTGFGWHAKAMWEWLAVKSKA